MVDSRAIALTGPKRAGKSTLAAALVAAGAEFLTDDVLAVSIRPAPGAVPGFGSFRLWEDSASRLALDTEYRAPGLGGKLNVRTVESPGTARREAVPLEAVYFLRPVDPEVGRGPQRTLLSGRAAALALVGMVKNGELLGGAEQVKLFEMAAELAAAVPCYDLMVPRSLEDLPRSAGAIRSWHSRSGAGDQP
jgi:hypothetical protein